MYKKASQLKLRFEIVKGSLSAEQLWDLSMSDLSGAIKKVKKILKKSDDDELSFLEDGNVPDTLNELRFAILKDVYLTRKKEAEDAMTELDKKQHNQKILELIASKKNEELQGKSVEELEKLLK